MNTCWFSNKGCIRECTVLPQTHRMAHSQDTANIFWLKAVVACILKWHALRVLCNIEWTQLFGNHCSSPRSLFFLMFWLEYFDWQYTYLKILKARGIVIVLVTVLRLWVVLKWLSLEGPSSLWEGCWYKSLALSCLPAFQFGWQPEGL